MSSFSCISRQYFFRVPAILEYGVFHDTNTVIVCLSDENRLNWNWYACDGQIDFVFEFNIFLKSWRHSGTLSVEIRYARASGSTCNGWYQKNVFGGAPRRWSNVVRVRVYSIKTYKMQHIDLRSSWPSDRNIHWSRNNPRTLQFRL